MGSLTFLSENKKLLKKMMADTFFRSCSACSATRYSFLNRSFIYTNSASIHRFHFLFTAFIFYSPLSFSIRRFHFLFTPFIFYSPLSLLLKQQAISFILIFRFHSSFPFIPERLISIPRILVLTLVFYRTLSIK